jgi:MtN3 and saliva related transmembrane protein
MHWIIIGALAAVFTMFAFFPQVFKALRTKSVRDVSLITLLQLGIGVSLWVAYGIHLKNAIIVVANSVTLFSVIILLALYFNYGRIK